MLVERHILSPHQLKIHNPDPFCYPPQDIIAAMLDAESTLDVALHNPDTDRLETIVQLVLFGRKLFYLFWEIYCSFIPDDVELSSNIQWGCVLKVGDLSAPTKLKLCGLLDSPEPHGKDWCLLALRIGLNQEKIAALDSQHSSYTMRLLTLSDCTIGGCPTLNEIFD